MIGRGGRADEGARLESVYAGFPRIEGSNPSLSANSATTIGRSPKMCQLSSRGGFGLVGDGRRLSGLFTDELVTGGARRGRFRRVRMCVWREGGSVRAQEDLESIDDVAERITLALIQVGVRVLERAPADLYAWLTRWFVPGDDGEDVLRQFPWNPNGRGGLEFVEDGPGDIAYAALHGRAPTTDGTSWRFDGQYSQFISLEGPRNEPGVGILTAEQSAGDQKQVLWDNMPLGTVLSVTLYFDSQTELASAIERTRYNSVGDGADAVARREITTEALDKWC